jgi:hypothetical protein
MIIPAIQMNNQSLRYFCTSFGFSSIWPVVIRVTMEINMNANGSETDTLFNPVSVISTIATSPPKMRNDRIISEFIMCLIRSTSISDHTAPGEET